MWLLMVMVLLANCDHAHGSILYGPCPQLRLNTYEESHIKPFQGKDGEILYFSNVRFEALFNGRMEIEERYLSYYAIALEQQQKDQCFQPFRLELKAKFVESPIGSTRRGALMLINTAILALHRKNYLLAFSCVQVGHNKLEYVWIFGRAGRLGVGIEKVQQMFGPWLANISTDYQDLRRTHHDLPFCKSILWSTVVYSVGSVLLLLILTVGLVCWKKHKQILQLRRSSCAEADFPTEETYNRENPRDITSAKTIAVMHGVVI